MNNILQSELGIHFSEFIKRPVDSVTKISYESINDIFEFKVAQTSYIGKFMRRKPIDDWERARFERSKLIMDLCTLNMIPVPHCLHASGHTFNNYHGSIYMSKCEGRRLQEVWETFDYKQKCKIASNLGKIIKKIHSIKYSELSFLKKFPYPENNYLKMVFLQELDLIKSRLISTRYLNLDLVNEAIQHLLDNQQLLDITPSLVHLDISDTNCLINPETLSITGILDWEWALLGDPVSDLTDLSELFHNDNSLADIFLEAYDLNKNDDFIKRIRFHTIYQQLHTSAIGYYFHNPYPEFVPRLEKVIEQNLKYL